MLIRLHATAKLLPSAITTIINSPLPLTSHHQCRLLHHSHPPSNPHLTNRSPLEYQSILKAFIARRAIQPGRQLHAHLCIIGFGYDTILATKLVDLYCSCNYLSNAHQLFDKIPKQNVFLWNILIRAYAWNGPYNTAVSLYYKMIDDGIVPDNFTFPFVLKACSNLSATDVGRDVHEHVVRTGWETDVFVGAALIDMYAKCGNVGSARQVFDKIPERDVVMWNSMLAAYAQNGHPEDCLYLCGEMAKRMVRPTVATLVTAISSAADMAAPFQGRELHGYSWRQGFVVQDKVKTALVDMYAKSGSVKVARYVFDMLIEKRVVSWNAMITGYAMHGYAVDALELFDKMTRETNPDHITFVGVLSACNHGGLLNKGKELFNLMIHEYKITPTVQHYSSMVDLIGHYGRLEEAYNMIKTMTIKPDSGIWGALLNSCKIHGNVELGELALEKLIELEPDEAGNYVIMSNIYAQAGKWEGVAKIRELMTNKKLKKDVACSWIDVNNKVHAFLSGDTSHPMCDEIDAELKRIEKLMIEAGYVPNVTPVFHDVDDDEKMKMVCRHSERLAIAFGLISTRPKSKLLITKNLRVCEDCHVAIKFISKITEREIVFRDVNRYHHFKDGLCSCGDYCWCLLSIKMDSLDKFSLRGYLAGICKDDPRKCWPFQELIDYHEFKLLEGSTPGSTKVESNRKGKEAVSQNPAAPNVESCGVGGNANFDVEEDSDCDLTVREFASKVKACNIKKNKNKRKALEVEEPGLTVADPRPAGSSDRLNPCGSVSVVGVAEPRVHDPASSSDALVLLCRVALRSESGGRVNRARGARVQALENAQPGGSSSGVQPLGLRSRMREPVMEIGGARVQAPTRPREQEVMVCRVSRNPAEFSTEHAKLFLRSL